MADVAGVFPRSECLPVFHHPCGRRTVVVGRWGHQLAHPPDCPDCKAYRDYLANQSTGES